MYKPSRILLIAFFRGQITDHQEKAAISKYIAADEDAAFVQECMEAAWNETISGNNKYMSAPHHWEKFKALAGIRNIHRNYVRPMLAAAATLTLIISLTAIYHFSRKKEIPAIAWQYVKASPQQTTIVTLADGSKVTLFPGSTLSYNNSYNNKERAVTLEGRGFFDIAAVADKPFTVATGKYITQVLGTSFDINEQRPHNKITITLVSGKVQLLHQQKLLSALVPDQQMTINTNNQQFNITNAASNSTVWINGHLSYDQALLSEVCQELEQWYGVHISIQRKALLQKHITASFQHLQLATVMNILSQTAGFHFSQDNNNINIW
jgi:ferric-dicitrate binding protein FerR (iron transport regulator)